VDFSGWSWGQDVKERFNLLKKAILSRHVLKFRYYGSNREETTRCAEPLKLVFRGHAWYLYAYCRVRNDLRFFKLSRMKDITMLEEGFSRIPPPHVLPEDIGGNTRTILVKLRAEPDISFRIYDEYPHGDIQQNADGTLTVRTTLPDGEWVPNYLLSYGDAIEVLEPEALRNEIIKKLKAMHVKYQLCENKSL
jgi:predicted DNA-binding transcriptional regulator YafY